MAQNKMTYRGIPVNVKVEKGRVYFSFMLLGSQYGNFFTIGGKITKEKAIEDGFGEAKRIIDSLLSGRKNEAKHE